MCQLIPACDWDGPFRRRRGGRRGTWSLETQRFVTTSAEIRELLAWLTERRVELVAMEATSDYWRPVYHTSVFHSGPIDRGPPSASVT